MRAHSDWIYIGTIYNNVGLLLFENQIHSSIYFKQLSPGSIVRIWRKYEPIVKKRRELTNSDIWRYFEYLYEESERLHPEISVPLDF
jgi:hypothetical protein